MFNRTTLKALLLASASLALAPLHANAKELTVYTYDSFTSEWGPGPIIKTAFEKECDCTLNFVAIDNSAAILNRVQFEGASSKADVVLGLGYDQMATALDTGLLTESGTDLSAVKLPVDWSSTTFVPYDFGHFAFVYNTKLMSEPPTSLEALINAPDDVKIIIQDPRTSTTGLGFMLWMKSVYGDEAAAKWKQLQPKILTVTKGWSEAYFSLFLNEEAPMVLSYETSPGYHMAIDKTDQYQAAAFDEGHYLQIEVAALLKNSPNQELGKQFLQFLISTEAQSALPLTNVMYPATDIGDAMPPEFSKLITPAESLLMDPAAVRDNRNAWIDEWLESSD